MLSAAELAPVHYGSRRSVWAFVLHVGRSAAACSSQRGCTREGRASPPPFQLSWYFSSQRILLETGTIPAAHCRAFFAAEAFAFSGDTSHLVTQNPGTREEENYLKLLADRWPLTATRRLHTAPRASSNVRAGPDQTQAVAS